MSSTEKSVWKPNRHRLIIATILIVVVYVVSHILALLFPFQPGQKMTLTFLLVNLLPVVFLAPPMFYVTVSLARWVVECKLGRR